MSWLLGGAMGGLGKGMAQFGEMTGRNYFAERRQHAQQLHDMNMARLRHDYRLSEISTTGTQAEGLEKLRTKHRREETEVAAAAQAKHREGEIWTDPNTGEAYRMRGDEAAPITRPRTEQDEPGIIAKRQQEYPEGDAYLPDAERDMPERVPFKGSPTGKSASAMPNDARMVEYMVGAGIAEDKTEAFRMLQTAKQNPYEAQRIAMQLAQAEARRQEESVLDRKKRDSIDTLYKRYLKMIQGGMDAESGGEAGVSPPPDVKSPPPAVAHDPLGIL